MLVGAGNRVTGVDLVFLLDRGRVSWHLAHALRHLEYSRHHDSPTLLLHVFGWLALLARSERAKDALLR